MIENIIKTPQWKDFQNKAQTIDKLASFCIQKQTSLLQSKYTPITKTIHLLKTLIHDFTTKATALEHQLQAISKISQTKYKNIYYQKRIQESLVLIQSLKNNINIKKSYMEKSSTEIKVIREQLIKLKISNIKICIAIQQYEQQYFSELSKQNHLIIQKNKAEHYQTIRNLIISRNNSFNSKKVKEEYNGLEKKLMEEIKRKLAMKKFIQQCFGVLKEKLIKQEKKANVYGLAGSMYFKLNAKNNKKNKIFNDSKLMIYDILKQKYEKYRKNEKKNNQQLIISKQQFLSFTPLQILGVIQLKGGLENIINKRIIINNNQKCDQDIKIQKKNEQKLQTMK